MAGEEISKGVKPSEAHMSDLWEAVLSDEREPRLLLPSMR